MYGYYPEELIEEIKFKNDIVDVVLEYVKLERKGKDFFGLCPFHNEKTPSFSVVPTKQMYYCFGCGKGGNVIHFIMNAENLDYIESIRLLADRVKIQLPESGSGEERKNAKLKQEILEINLEAARFFFDNLNSAKGEIARKYFKDRSIHEPFIKKFGLGYSPEEWDKLFNFLDGKKFSKEAVIKSGLIIEGKKGGFYDRFRSRIMFPIFDVRGNVIGFGGRVIDSSMPKYMNSPETPVYNKGRNLYALNFAKNSKKKWLLIVEGYMDAIALYQNGITNTVASLGTALTDGQGRLLKKYSEEIIISFDSDAAGRAATLRGLDLLNELGCNVKVLTLPQGKDPDDYIRINGIEEFNKLIKNSTPLVEYKIRNIKKEIDTVTTEGKIKFLEKATGVLSKIENNVEKEMYIKKIAKEYDISEESIYMDIHKKTRTKGSFKSTIKRKNSVESTSHIRPTAEKENRQIIDERILLGLLCIDNTVFRNVKDKLSLNLFTDNENRRIAEVVIDKLERNENIEVDELLDIAGVNVVNAFAGIISELRHCDDINKAIVGKIKNIEMFIIKDNQRKIIETLKNETGLPEGDVEKLKQQLIELTLSIKKRKSS